MYGYSKIYCGLGRLIERTNGRMESSNWNQVNAGFFCFFVFNVRFVLAVGSAVFDAMFNGGMATTSTEIELPDVEPAAFLALLK